MRSSIRFSLLPFPNNMLQLKRIPLVIYLCSEIARGKKIIPGPQTRYPRIMGQMVNMKKWKGQKEKTLSCKRSIVFKYPFSCKKWGLLHGVGAHKNPSFLHAKVPRATQQNYINL